MQDDTPQGDPRLQPIQPGPEVATGYVDPCIVYLETSLPGEIPLVAACWARSSREIREPGKSVRLELSDTIVFEYRRHRFGWLAVTKRAKSLTLKHGLTDRLPACSFFHHRPGALPPVFQWAVRYINAETDTSLRRQFQACYSPNSRKEAVARRIFELSRLDWPSIAEILEVKGKPQRIKHSKQGHPTLMRRLISSLFKKKSKPIAA